MIVITHQTEPMHFQTETLPGFIQCGIKRLIIVIIFKNRLTATSTVHDMVEGTFEFDSYWSGLLKYVSTGLYYYQQTRPLNKFHDPLNHFQSLFRFHGVLCDGQPCAFSPLTLVKLEPTREHGYWGCLCHYAHFLAEPAQHGSLLDPAGRSNRKILYAAPFHNRECSS
jgi:hypothetical protein